jgi:7-cyano-7-deazaguanine synthase
MDSATLLYHLAATDAVLFPLAVNYGQRHRYHELLAAENVVERAQKKFEGVGNIRVIDVPSFAELADTSSQTSDAIAVPEGHYEDASMKQTVVPNRNMVLIALATAYAIARKCSQVAYAAHAGDHAIYPDCRPAFARAMEEAMLLCDYDPIGLRAPFLGITKAGIVALGTKLEVPFDLTYSCYKGRPFHCGKCGTCTERREAFALAGVADPTVYEGDA